MDVHAPPSVAGADPAVPPRSTGTATGTGPDFSRTLAAALRAPSAPTPPTPADPRSRRLTLGQMLSELGTAPAAATLGGMLAGPTAAPASPRSVARTSSATAGLGIGPVARPLAQEVGSPFGPRMHPIHGVMKQHTGVDMGAPTGTPIAAFAGGEVTFAGPRGGYGNLVIVDHGDGLTTRYAHASALDVQVGDRVAAGEQIARVGSTGLSTAPHLHFELRRDGTAVDPEPYLP